jgi:predicted amidohydrolase
LVKVAVAQAHLEVGDVPANISETLRLIDLAAKQNAQIVVLPELANSGYVYKNKQELIDALADIDVLKIWKDKSKELNNITVAGFAEVQGEKVYNRSVIIENGKILDIYTKVHLFNDEKEIFTPGDSPPKVIQTSIGKIASMICYDLEFPELVRLVAENGVELLCVPTNWPEGSFNRSINEPRPMELIKAMSAAATNRIWIALSDRCGEERNISWLEASSVIDPDGWPIAQVGTGAGIVVADIDLAVSRDKSLSPKNHALNDRRPEIYK